MYRCPVCFYPKLWRPPEDHLICPSCGTQFGYSDEGRTIESLRKYWIETGAKWHSKSVPKPIDWNGLVQMGLQIDPTGSEPNTMTVNFFDPNITTVNFIGSYVLPTKTELRIG